MNVNSGYCKLNSKQNTKEHSCLVSEHSSVPRIPDRLTRMTSTQGRFHNHIQLAAIPCVVPGMVQVCSSDWPSASSDSCLCGVLYHSYSLLWLYFAPSKCAPYNKAYCLSAVHSRRQLLSVWAKLSIGKHWPELDSEKAIEYVSFSPFSIHCMAA